MYTFKFIDDTKLSPLINALHAHSHQILEGYLETREGHRVFIASVSEVNNLAICFDNTLELGKHINNKNNTTNSIAQ